MKFNIICEQNTSVNVLDTEVLNFIFRKFPKKHELQIVNVNNFKTNEVSVNIFLSCVNLSLFNYAKKNIMIFDHQNFNKKNMSFLKLFDKVFVKSKYTLELLNNYVDENKLEYINWRSPDIQIPTIKKNYNDYLIYYNNLHIPLQQVLDNWTTDMPNLNVILGVNNKDLKLVQQDNITYHGNKLDTETFHILFNKCGFHLCLNQCESFSHDINQTQLVKSIPIVLNSPPAKEQVNNETGYFIQCKKKKNKDIIGSKFNIDIQDFKDKISKFTKISEVELNLVSKNSRISSLKSNQICYENIKKIFDSFLDEVKKTKYISYDKIEIKHSSLPHISLITLTHNRKHIFPLAILNYNASNYPKDKIEWIICDDGTEDNKVRSLFPDDEAMQKMNIKYISLDERISIGEKRNLCISKATHDIIVMMDDDDYYPPESIEMRVKNLMKSDKQCVCCTTLGCFDINKFVSLISASSNSYTYSENVSEATLCFYKSYWENNKFKDCSTHECDTFINENYDVIKEIPFEKVINSLIHKNNSSSRFQVTNQQPNGCHFGWNEKLFKFITSLDK